HRFHVAKRLPTRILTNSVVSLHIAPPLRNVHGDDLVRKDSVPPRPRRIPVRSNGKRVLLLASDAERRVFGNILRGKAHNEITHRIRETHHQTDSRRIALKVKELGNQGESASRTFSKASGFPVLQDEVSHGLVVYDRNPAHRLHADHEHRVSITTPDTQASIVECRHSRSTVFPSNCIGGDGRRKDAPSDGGRRARAPAGGGGAQSPHDPIDSTALEGVYIISRHAIHARHDRTRRRRRST